jgi:methylenetetrahydrofolate reductase (NADPH)
MMAMSAEKRPSSVGLADLLRGYSSEVTSGDRKSIEAATTMLRPGDEVFIASLPSDTNARQALAASHLKRAGLTPVPHVVARNITSLAELDVTLRRLTNEAGVDRVLVLAGDREQAAGELHSSLQLLESGLLSKHGIRKIAISAYPEGHPRIASADLVAARAAKLAAAEKAGLEVTLVSQFCFDAAPIISLAEQIRAEGVKAPLRIGVAGPASRTSLLKYALICGVGASVRALKERQAAARNMLAGETPEELLTELARAQTANPALGLSGVHFFTFASLATTANWVEEQRRSNAPALAVNTAQ